VKDADAAANKEAPVNEVEFNDGGQGDEDDLPQTFSDDGDVEAELEAFYTIITESFEDVDVDNVGLISVEQLGTILDQLTEEGVLNQYQPEDLEMLAADMDIDGTHLIPKGEFIDVLFRREQGYVVQEKGTEHTFHLIGKAPMDFTDKELEEAFSVFDIKQAGKFGAKEIRGVMQAVAETDVKALDAHKMIEAAASTPDQAAIDLEEFKRIIRWTPGDEEE